MPSVGETLKQERLRQGLDLAAVAAYTKINTRYLEAIEADARESLPGGFFYKSFVAQYAKALSLDEKKIEAEVNRSLSEDEPLPLPGVESIAARKLAPITVKTSVPHGRTYASAGVLILVLVACSGFYGWWRSIKSTPPAAQPRLSASAAQPDAPSAIAAQPTFAAAQPAMAAIAAPIAPKEEGKANDPVDTSVAAPASPDDKVMVDLMAHEPTWISVSSDGKPVFSGVLQTNETKSVSGKLFAKMRIGNAAGLEVRLNRKLLAPLGARGQVLVVLFTPDNFQIVSPPKEDD